MCKERSGSQQHCSQGGGDDSDKVPGPLTSTSLWEQPTLLCSQGPHPELSPRNHACHTTHQICSRGVEQAFSAAGRPLEGAGKAPQPRLTDTGGLVISEPQALLAHCTDGETEAQRGNRTQQGFTEHQLRARLWVSGISFCPDDMPKHVTCGGTEAQGNFC